MLLVPAWKKALVNPDNPSALGAGANGKILVADNNGDPSWTTMSGDATLSGGTITLASSQTSIQTINNDMFGNKIL